MLGYIKLYCIMICDTISYCIILCYITNSYAQYCIFQYIYFEMEWTNMGSWDGSEAVNQKSCRDFFSVSPGLCGLESGMMPTSSMP